MQIIRIHKHFTKIPAESMYYSYFPSLYLGQLFSTVFLLSTVSTVPFLLSLVVVTVISFFKSSLRSMDTILRTNILVFLVSQSYKRRELFLTFYFIYIVN